MLHKISALIIISATTAAFVLFPNLCSTALGQSGSENQSSPAAPPGVSLKLKGTSSGGSYLAEVNWSPAEPGLNNSFYVSIYDSNHKWLPSASYNFTVDGAAEAKRTGENASETTRIFRYQFAQQGAYSIVLSNINGSGESIQIPIQVTPEFPTSVVLAVASVIGAVVIVGRTNIFKQQHY